MAAGEFPAITSNSRIPPEELKLKFFRGIAILLTQVPVILIVGAKYDLIFGFNRMDSGFGTLLFLFVFVPLFNLSWLITEMILIIKWLRHRDRSVSFLMPCMALFFLAESLATDLYLISQMRM